MILLNSFTTNQINKLQKFFGVSGSACLKQTLTTCPDDLFVEALYLCLLNKIPSSAEIDGDRLILHVTDREKLINSFHSICVTSNIPDIVDYPVTKEIGTPSHILEPEIIQTSPKKPRIKSSKSVNK